MTPFALELLINLVLVSLIFIFQIPKRILCLILNKISIYLPFNNSDLETIKKLKHEKNKESGIVRSCNLNEYISILKDDDNIFSSKAYSRIDMFLYFYSCIIIILLTKPFFLKDDLTNMINGFGIFFIFYSLYVSLCYIIQEKNKIKFTIGIIISFIIYMMISIYYKEFWSIDEKEVIENIKETLSAFHRKEIFKDSNVTNNNYPFYFKHVNPLNLNFFFGIIFSIFLSILYIMKEDTYYFDVILINLDPKNDEIIQKCDEKYRELLQHGVDVLYDDTDRSIGEKFTIADLLGIPKQIIIGKKSYPLFEEKNR